MAELFDDDEQKRKEEQRKKLQKLKDAEKEFENRMHGEQGNLFVGPTPTPGSVTNGPEANDAFDPEMESLLDDSEDPSATKAMWHETQNMILGAIPKGQVRRFVLDEKKLFLQGSASTTDSKFSFKAANHRAYTMVETWLRSGIDLDGIELSMAFWQLNETLGFHSRKVQAKFKTGFTAHLNALREKRKKGSQPDAS